MAAPRRYWLIKSEPEVYGIDDLERDRRTGWEGVRNYRARNFMRDDMKIGDGVLFYHSNAEPPAIAGIAKVVSDPYPDPAQFDPKSHYYDPKVSPEEPRWFQVDFGFVAKLADPLPLPLLREQPELAGMALLARGQRLSVQPVEPEHWRFVCKLGRIKAQL